jgi:hypothetical protein
MALNPFFLQGSQTEQSLIQDLINEQLRMYGVEIYYIPRKYITKNTIIQEVIESEFDNAYPIEAYLNNYEGYSDNTQLLSKFGIQATNEINLIISKERFESYISPLIKNLSNIELSLRPKEGDLIYFPLGDRLFEIKFVEHEKPFYQLQKNYVYELRCELFRYEDEVIDTNIDEIDDSVDIEANLQTLTLVGSGSTATAIAGIVNGAVNNIIITNRGEKYINPPVVAISSSPNIGGTASGISTLINNITNCDGTQIGSRVQGVYITNPGFGYTVNPGVVFIPTSSDNTGTGAAATTRISDGVVGIITITSGGSGYSVAPTITFSSPGIGTTATAISVVSSAGTISNIYIINAGAGYTEAPTITIGSPYISGIGTFIHNEIITGSQSGTTARVKSWNVVSGIMNISNSDGDFVTGEIIIGSESGAEYSLRLIEKYNTVSNYADNDEIEIEADLIIDFDESNPFGNP